MYLRHYCNSFFQYFSKPVSHPLCVSQAFLDNATACVTHNCTAYEQSAFAAVAEIECPAAQHYPINVTSNGVREALKKTGGAPQVYQRFNNQAIECQNGTKSGRGAGIIRVGGTRYG